MYRTEDKHQLQLENFYLPFGGSLNPKNRWVQLSKLVPWDEFEKKYEQHFSKENLGAPAKSFRMALGALIIKEKLDIPDRELVEQIIENPYLQFLIGLERYQAEAPFDASMLVHFRKRITAEMLQEINERIHEEQIKKNDKKEDDSENKGKLLIDATCTPADIRYPTDLSLLNEAREKLEKIIDILHRPLRGKEKKVRTYRKQARKDFLNIAKKRKPGKKLIQRGIKKQLQYIRRNLLHIEKLKEKTPLSVLDKGLYRKLLVISELYRQQRQMYETKTHVVPERIVSISQPHVRPIVRGKDRAAVEFGAKISVSLVDGYAFLEKLSWNAYNEGTELIEHVESYKNRFGYYPESVHVDQIYRNRENRQYCKDKGIRMSGPPLGRPPKDRVEHRKMQRESRQDERDRIPIEGKFGNGKRRYGMSKIKSKLKETSETTIGTMVLVMNLEKILRDLLLPIFYLLYNFIFRWYLRENY